MRRYTVTEKGVRCGVEYTPLRRALTKQVWRISNGLIVLVLILTGCASTGSGGGGWGSPRRGAPWTIRCLELHGSRGLATVEQVAESLRHTPGIRADDVFVRQNRDGFARLYYGTYYRRLDRRTGRRTEPAELRHDLDLLHELGVGDSRRLFLGAIAVRMPMPDVGNPAWDLRRLAARYSLQVAVFEPTDEFFEYKQAAADYCKLLRDRGYEAYYYHAPASSSVTVGSFGSDAIVVGADGKTHYSDAVKQWQQKDELFKYNLLNGAIYRVRNETGLSEPVPSRLVEAPSRE